MRADAIGPTTVRLECRVRGCGTVYELPVQYRLEVVGERVPGDWAGMNVRVVVDVDATLDLEAPLRVHLDEHATNGAPPVVDPPSWPEVEWCDDGGSCEHPACLERTSVEAAWRADAELEARATSGEGWRA